MSRPVDEVFLSHQSKVLSNVWTFSHLKIILSSSASHYTHVTVAFITTKNLLFVCGALSLLAGVAHAQMESATLGGITGIIQDQQKKPIAGATIAATRLDDNTTRMATSGADGAYTVHGVPPGRYSIMAQMTGYQEFTVSSVIVMPGQIVDMADITLVAAGPGPVTNAAHGGFWKRFAKVYADDWHDRNPEVPAQIPRL